MLFLTDTDAGRDAFAKSMLPLAKQYEEYLNFVTVDAREYPDMGAALGFYKSETGLAVQNTATGDVYPYPHGRSITPEAVEQFIIDISTGAAKAWDGNHPSDSEHDEL